MATEKVLNTVIQLRNGTAAEWASSTLILRQAEIGIENDTGLFKIGNGKDLFKDLEYANDIKGQISKSEHRYLDVEKADGDTDQQAIDKAIAAYTNFGNARNGDVCIVRKVISEGHWEYTAYAYSNDVGGWIAMDGNYNADNVYFSDDMLVTKEIGYITLTNGQGKIPSKGKNLSGVFEAMFVKEQNPTTTQPSVNLTFGEARAYEVGTVVSPTYSATFNAGSYTYGPATGVTVTSWEISDTAGHTASTASGSFADVTVADGTNYKITAKANHTAGAIPLTNKENEYAAGKIAAGSKSKVSNAITGYRSFFYGVLDTSSTEAPLTSAIIRGLTNGGAYNASKTFTLNGSATAKRIVIAVPSNSTRAGLKEVILTSAMNTPVTDSYVKTTAAVKVEGVNGATAIDYNVYCYEPAAIDAGEVHKITLA